MISINKCYLGFVNKILNRQLKIKDINQDMDDQKTIRLIPESSFDSFFSNLGEFIEKTIYENQIQLLVAQAIEDYMNDQKLTEELRYKEGAIFKENNKVFNPILKRKDIDSIHNFLKHIKINDKGFDELCEEKIWKDEFYDEIVPKPNFYNSTFDNQNN